MTVSESKTVTAHEIFNTIIVDSYKELKEMIQYKKNIVYIGNEDIGKQYIDRFFWSPQLKIKQIMDSKIETKKLDIPVIMCKMETDIDEMFLLTELYKKFYEANYNIFTVSFEAYSVLYDLEYVPIECIGEKNRKHFYSFIYQQTYYKKSDAIIIGIKEDAESVFKNIFGYVDIIIKISKAMKRYNVNLMDNSTTFFCGMFKCLDLSMIQKMYCELEIHLTEVKNE